MISQLKAIQVWFLRPLSLGLWEISVIACRVSNSGALLSEPKLLSLRGFRVLTVNNVISYLFSKYFTLYVRNQSITFMEMKLKTS